MPEKKNKEINITRGVTIYTKKMGGNHRRERFFLTDFLSDFMVDILSNFMADFMSNFLSGF